MHGELDPSHSREIDDMLDSLPLGKSHLEMIGVSTLHTCEWLASSVQALKPVEFLGGVDGLPHEDRRGFR